MKSHHRLAAVINLSVVVQAADSPELRLAAAAALPCGQSCALRGWCTRVLRQVWQAKECASALATTSLRQRLSIRDSLLGLPVGLVLQILDCRFPLARGHLFLEAFFGFAEGCVTS
jgi:hypothetical protein